jgi:hypothetical protein
MASRGKNQTGGRTALWHAGARCVRAGRQMAAIMTVAVFAAVSAAYGDCQAHWDAAAATTWSTFVSDSVVFDDGSGEALWAVGTFPGGGRLARWDGTQWTVLTTSFNDSTMAIAVFDDGGGPALYVGGRFTLVDGETARGLVKLTALGWTEVGGGLHAPPSVFWRGTASVLRVWDDGSGPALYVGGTFAQAGFTTVNNIARWNGSSWSALGSGTAGETVDGVTTFGTVLSMAAFDDGSGLGESLYVGGGFAYAGGWRVNGMARWDGFSWSHVGTGMTLSEGWCCTGVAALAAFDDGSGPALYAGGFFHQAGNAHVHSLARWNGTTWSAVGGLLAYVEPTWADFVNVFDLAVFNDGSGAALYVGGEFHAAGGVVVNNLARWDGAWSAVDGGVGDYVHSLSPFNDGSKPMLIVSTGDGVRVWAGCVLSVDPDASHIALDRSVVSSFGGLVRVSVTPVRFDGEPLGSGETVVIDSTAGQLLGAVFDAGDGAYVQYLQADVSADGAVVSATVNGVMLNNTAEVAFVPVDPTLSTVSVSVTQTFLGGQTVVTVVPRDNNGSSVGGGLEVVISTTRGSLVDSATYIGAGSYTQTITATQVGTAAISATVDGLPLESIATFSVLDPAIYGRVLAYDAHGTVHAYMSIQAAVEAAAQHGLDTIYVAPGEYHETILFEEVSGLTLEALAAEEPVVVQGFIISRSDDVMLQFFTVDATNSKKDAVLLQGRTNASANVELVGLTITGAQWNGIVVESENEHVTIRDCLITGNGRNGIILSRNGGPYLIEGCEIIGNAYNGVDIGRDVVVTLIENTIADNGTAGGHGGGRYGVFRERMPHMGEPQQVTLLNNVIVDNNGRVHAGRSDENIGNYDQIIDETDSQPPYTD